jgi:hypothetical protein
MTVRPRTFSMIAAVLMLGASVVMAQEQTRPERPQRDRSAAPLAGPDAPAPGQRRGEGMTGRQMGARVDPFVQTVQELALSDAQKEQVRTILAEHQGAVRAFQQEHGEKIQEFRTKINEARQAENQELMRTLAQQQRELMAKGPQPAQLHEKLRKVLTEEQSKALDVKLEEQRKAAEEQRRARQQQQGGPQGTEGQRPGRGEGQRPQRPAPQGQLEL